LFTRQTSVAPKLVDTPKWSAFLTEVTNGDVELEAYLQRLVGYCLTGSTREHVLAFLYGSGGNGKGVFLNTVVRALGSYATVAAMDTFTASRSDKHPTDLAALAGSRLVTAQETQEGRSWDEAKVKSITGGDPISARFMRQDFFTYIPQFKILFAGNHKPRLHNVDNAMKRRFHLVPFLTTPKRVNKSLADELVHELPGILQWAVEGCMAWRRDGLNPPRAVLAATETYFMDEDAQGRWLLERTDPVPEVTGARELYSDWCAWCSENGEEPGSFRAFNQSLRGRGMAEGRMAGSRGFKLAVRKGEAAVFPTPPVDIVEDLIPTGRRKA
jgi:putative DNA primase/helicase